MSKLKRRTCAALALAFTSTAVFATPKLPDEFEELPKIIQDDLNKTRSLCREQYFDEDRQWKEPDPMNGTEAFYLGSVPAVLVNDKYVCGNDIRIKGADCHTWGCNVKIYGQVNGGWRKLLDEPVGQFIFNVNNDRRLIHLVFLFTQKYTEKCGNSWTADCTYLARWQHGKFTWQNLGGGRP